MFSTLIQKFRKHPKLHEHKWSVWLNDHESWIYKRVCTCCMQEQKLHVQFVGRQSNIKNIQGYVYTWINIEDYYRRNL